MELRHKHDYEKAMCRVEAWAHGEVVDRAPVRFSRHNAQYDTAKVLDTARWLSIKDRWMDAEFQVDSFLELTEKRVFRGETFPVYWPNLGPDIYAAFFGCGLTFGEVTSWSHPIIDDISNEGQFCKPVFDESNVFLCKIRELTKLALEKCDGRALVGVTCWGQGIDCVAAWRSPENLCMDLILEPDRVKGLLERSLIPFHALVKEFNSMIMEKGLPSVGWMEIPLANITHIAQTDFANMISPAQFDKFCLPSLRKEIAGMERVIFHMDGKGVANHLDFLLAEPGITAIQWAQGVGDDEPIMQWVPLIMRIQAAGKSVVVDLKPYELEPFMEQVRPEGIFLSIAADDHEQEAILRRLLKWR